MFKAEITKEEVNELPLRSYEGKVSLISDATHLPALFEEISRHEVVGFDTETKPTFRKGEINHVSLIQIAVPEKIYLVRIKHTGMTTEMNAFFENKKITKVGIGLRDDIIDLQKLKAFDAQGFLDLKEIVKEACILNEGLRKLTGILLEFRVSKSQQTSNWENPQLTPKQIAYAATDAWVCLEMYNKLQKLGYV